MRRPLSRVDTEPIRSWLLNRFGEDVAKISQHAEFEERTVRAIIKHERATIRIDSVDRLLTNLGEPHVLEELYPLDECV